MVFSFVVNGLFTFRTERLTLRQAALFVATTGTVMWVAQPLLIHGWLWALEHVVDDGDLRLAAAKLASIACSLALNFAAYRFVVWPVTHHHEDAALSRRPRAPLVSILFSRSQTPRVIPLRPR